MNILCVETIEYAITKKNYCFSNFSHKLLPFLFLKKNIFFNYKTTTKIENTERNISNTIL